MCSHKKWKELFNKEGTIIRCCESCGRVEIKVADWTLVDDVSFAARTSIPDGL